MALRTRSDEARINMPRLDINLIVKVLAALLNVLKQVEMSPRGCVGLLRVAGVPRAGDAIDLQRCWL